MKKKILVTGGAGYIGSHTVTKLLDKGYEISVVDNLSNSSPNSIKRVEKITGKKIHFYKVDLLDWQDLEKIFVKSNYFGVIHFAGLKAVGESVENPLHYYENNISGSINLFKMMIKYGVNNLVFSSSACVYGDPDRTPITEKFPLKPTNPYGQTKMIIEQIIKDINVAYPKFNAVILRYFNPIGAHQSGLIGEDPRNIPNNLVPYISQVAVGKLKSLKIFGNDYKTKDGTGVRDYIHIMDLAEGHLKALEKLMQKPGVVIYNLGTGRGYSVLEVLRAFEKACKKQIPFEIVERRKGDAATVFADPSLAKKELNWKATRDINKMCEDVWRWQATNPNGFD